MLSRLRNYLTMGGKGESNFDYGEKNIIFSPSTRLLTINWLEKCFQSENEIFNRLIIKLIQYTHVCQRNRFKGSSYYWYLFSCFCIGQRIPRTKTIQSHFTSIKTWPHHKLSQSSIDQTIISIFHRSHLGLLIYYFTQFPFDVWISYNGYHTKMCLCL